MAGLTRRTIPLTRSVATRLVLPLWLAGLTLGAVLLSLAFPTTIAADPYRVESGDSLSSIAQRYGLSQGVLEALNPSISSPDLLYVGQMIALPDNIVPVTTAARITHVVQAGDSVNGIAAFYGVAVADLLALNPGQSPDLLFAGVELLVRDDLAPPGQAESTTPIAVTLDPEPPANADPAPTTSPGTAPSSPSGIGTPAVSFSSSDGPKISGLPVSLYRIQPGDTFSGLAQRFSTTVETLLRFNPSVLPNRLLVSSVFWVPRDGGIVESTPPTRTTPSPQQPTVPHLVIPGDSATAIASRYGLTLSQLQALNPDLSLSTIFIGQILRVPGTPDQTISASPVLGIDPASGDAPPDSIVPELVIYTVKSGDSGYALAETYKLSLADLASLNPAVNFNNLRIGQALFVPDIDLPPPPPGTVAAGPPPPNSHIVQPGDNLSLIANRFGVETSEIIALNDGIDPNIISVDQQLRIPGTMPVPIVSETVMVGISNDLQTLAARLGRLPHTLLANNPSLNDWVPAGTSVILPAREGVLVTIQRGDTLRGIAQQFGSSIDAIAGDPRNGVIGPNQLIVGQEIVIPIHVPDFVWPVADGIITDGFGLCRSPSCDVQHRGLDISKADGSPIFSIADGTVDFVGGSYCCGLGFHVIIVHDNGFETVYAHLNGPPPVFEGQEVAQGETIGYVGTTGYSTGPHLHLELHHNQWFLNALNYLP